MEQRLNRGLHERGVNRVILDSRPVHAANPNNEAIRDAQRKKPKVQVNAVMTASHPMVCFIGSDNPDIAQVPELVNTLWHDLSGVLPEIGTVPSIPHQPSLF